MAYVARLKRLVLGRAISTDQGPRRSGRLGSVSSLSSDALSSNVYATQEILIVLAVGGFGLYRYGPMVAALVAGVFALVVIAYRYVVRAYPGGGADYEVAAANLGPRPAVTVAAAMLIDFSLTLAVSVAAALQIAVSLLPGLDGSQVALGVLVVAVMAFLALRGGAAVAGLLRVGTIGFVVAILITTAVAAVQVLSGSTPRAASADWETVSTSSLAGFALVVVLARAFSSGSIAVTGVESVGTGVPTMRRTSGARAAATVTIVGVLSIALFVSVTWLAMITDVRMAPPDQALTGRPADEPQQSLIVQVADAVFGSPWGVIPIAVVTVLILVAAGMSSFRSFSTLSSILARDGFLPRQLRAQGDRLVYSNGIILLALTAGVLLWVFGASLTLLIQLYVVGVFLALALGQTGMVRHWSRRLQQQPPRDRRRALRVAWAVAVVGQVVTWAVLVVVTVSKFLTGAWLVVLLVPLLARGMLAVQQHYETLEYELAAEEEAAEPATSDVHAIILATRIQRPTLRALAYARATRPTTLEALTVAVDADQAAQLSREWEERGIPVPLRILPSPFRQMSRPVLSYVTDLRRTSPETLVVIYIPEYVVTQWWERLLHNRSSARLQRLLSKLPNVVVVSVPWQRAAAEQPQGQHEPAASGGVTGMTGALPRVDGGQSPDAGGR